MSETTATSSTERSQDSDSSCMVKDSYPIHRLKCIPASFKSNYAVAHNRMANLLFVHHPHCSSKAETANYSHKTSSLMKPCFPLKGGVLLFFFLTSLISEHL